MRGVRIPLDAVLVAALTAVAAALRLYDLGWMPLDVAEAAASLPAWRAAHGQAVEALPGSMLLFHKQRAFFMLGFDGDAWARFAPAMAGIALVPLSALLAPGLGRAAALAAAAVFALDPLWTFFGRQASAATFSSLLVVAAIAAWMRGGRPARDIGAGAAALALVAGGVAFTAALALAVTAVIRRVAGPLPVAEGAPTPVPTSDGDRPASRHEGDRLAPTGADSVATVDRGPRPDRSGPGGEVLRWFAIFVGTLVLAATGAFSRPDGLGAVVAGGRDWLGQMAGGAGDPWHGFALPLLVYAPLLTLFGLAGALWAPRRVGNLGLFLQVWALLALSVGGASGQPSLVPHALLPLTLAAALALTRWAEAMRAGFRWGDDGVAAAIVVMVAAYGLAAAATFTGAATPEDGSADWQRAWLSWVIGGGLLVIYGVAWGLALVGRVAGLASLIALGGLAWANGARLCYGAGLDVRELLRPEYVTASAGELARALGETGGPAVVDPALAPALGWALRGVPDMTWRAATAAEPGAVVVQLPGAVPIAPGDGMRRVFPVAAGWTPDFAGRLAFLRWYLHRRPAVSANPAADGPQFVRVDVVEGGAP